MSTSTSTKAATARTPFLFTSQEFVGKMIDRGFDVNVELRNRLYMLASQYRDDGCSTLPVFWKECELESVYGRREQNQLRIQEIRHMLIIFSTLEKYKINYVNLVVIFVNMPCQQRKNLYRHYYLEWVKRNNDSTRTAADSDAKTTIVADADADADADATPSVTVNWLHTPREFSRLDNESLVSSWRHMIAQFLCSGHFELVVFFINQFYTYMAPFV